MAGDGYQIDQEMDFTPDNIGDFLLNILTRGLYNQPDLILREYIQNCHDAICGWQQMPVQGRVDIRVDWPNIHIFDNGPGMDRVELSNAMRNIGKSYKDISASTGFMGIGKLAGLSMASTVEIHSSKLGDPHKNWVRFDSGTMLASIMQRRKSNEHKSIIETLNNHTWINPEPLEEDPDKHYTVVHLLDVQEEYKDKVTDIVGFARSIGLLSPIAQDPSFEHTETINNLLLRAIPNHYKPLELFVNGKQIFRPYVEGLDKPIEVEVEDSTGNLMAYGWACLNTDSERYHRQIPEDDLRGIALLKRGIAIGSRKLPEDMGLYTSSSNVIYFRWYCGEIYIVDPEIVVSADRTRIRQSPKTLEFIEGASKEFRRLARKAEQYSTQDNAASVILNTTKTVQEIKNQIETEGISSDRLPSIVSKLGQAQANVESRKKHIKDTKKQQEVSALENQIDSILTTLVRDSSEAQDEALPLSSINEIDDDISKTPESSSEIKPLIEIVDISEELDFTARETHIYQTIISAIADFMGGKEKDQFAHLLKAIEAKLLETLGERDKGAEAD